VLTLIKFNKNPVDPEVSNNAIASVLNSPHESTSVHAHDNFSDNSRDTLAVDSGRAGIVVGCQLARQRNHKQCYFAASWCL